MKTQHSPRSVGLAALRNSMVMLLLFGRLTASAAQTTGCMGDYLADGFCDPQNNSADCGYDGGDCCEASCMDGVFLCGENQLFNCIDPAYLDDSDTGSYTFSFECDDERMGNSFCDSINNHDQCGYDGGDCCSCTCAMTPEGIGCGPAVEYTCLDHSASCFDGHIEAGAVTTVTVSANAYDARPGEGEGDVGCFREGCKAGLTRDGDNEDDEESRWSCRQSLVPDGEPCEITFSFAQAQDIGYVQVAFYKADQRSRTVQVTSNGEDMGHFESSSGSSFTAFDIHAGGVETLTLTAGGLDADEWISFLEVRFMLEESQMPDAGDGEGL